MASAKDNNPLATVSPDWAQALEPVSSRIGELFGFVAAEEAAGRTSLPETNRILRAFQTPLNSVRVLIVGQDPYPTVGHACGLAFSVDPAVSPMPRSLKNIFTELRADVGAVEPRTGDLSPWADQGVLLLNRCLTVQAGAPASHRGIGWEEVTARAVSALVARGGPLVAILWGKQAQELIPALGSVPIIASAHPSPLSAARGFFGSGPFSRANDALRLQGASPIDWQLPG
ncbi:MAG TPA: uracil-DNA glycosylase [Aeromicrobium sp.]|nr:uracil-DNA glycosylase [Aeromicrobium sp.]